MVEEYLYENLTHDINGASFEVFKALGYGYREKVYQRALAEEFDFREINYKKELPVDIFYREKLIAKYYLDFLVDEKVVVEIKVAKDFYSKDIKQVLSYLKANNYKLGLLIIFTQEGAKCKRIIN